MKEDCEKEVLKLLDILSPNFLPVKEDVIIKLSNETRNNIHVKSQKCCKILKFSSEWNFDEVLSKISRLESQNYPKLFIFIVEAENFGFLESIKEKSAEKVKVLQENVLNFIKNRPMVLQLISLDENVTKLFYKDEYSEEIQEMKEQDEEMTDFDDFPTFLWLYLREKIENFQNKMLEKFPKVKNSLLILRFLRILKFREKFFMRLIFKCSAEGSTSDILAIIDENFDENEEIQLKYFSDPHNFILTFEAAVARGNQEVKEFFVKYCNKLPFYGKVKISSAAYNNNKMNTLCDLLEFWDFPFPNRYLDPVLITNVRLLNILKSRYIFLKDILVEDLPKIENFLRNNPNLKFAYDPKNQSAFCHALESKKFKSFSHLIDISYQNLNEHDFKVLTANGRNISKIIASTLEIQEIENLIDKIKNKTDSKFISEAFKMKNNQEENIFSALVQSGCTSVQKFKWLIKFMEKFLDSSEIIKIMKCGKYNSLFVCVQNENTRQLAILFEIFKNIFDSSQKFKDFVRLKYPGSKKDILHFTSNWKTKESHQTLMRLMLNTFDDRDELKDFFMQKDDLNKNFIHHLLINDKTGFSNQIFTKLKEIFNNDQYSQILRSKGHYYRNLLQVAAYKSNDINQFQTVWKNFQEFFDPLKFFDMIIHDLSGDNILINSIKFKSIDICEFIFNEIKRIADHDKPQIQNKLKKSMMHSDKNGDNIAHFLVVCNYKSDKIQIMFKKLKEILIQDQYEEILKSKGFVGRNLLQMAAYRSKDIKKHQFLWKIFRDFYKSDQEFLEFLKEVDNNNSNFFHFAAYFTSKEIFEFIIKYLETTTSNEEIREIFKTLGEANRNLLKSAITNNESVELHEYLWTIIKKYFNSQEILDMIQHFDYYGYNHLFYAVKVKTKETWELTWNEIKSIFTATEINSTIQQYLSCVNNNHENFLHKLVNFKDSLKLKYFWSELENYFTKQQIKNLLSQKTLSDEQNVLQYTLWCEEIEFIGTFWKLLLNTFENREELKDLIMQGDKDGNNYVHCLIKFDKPEILELTFRKIKENFNDDQNEEILKSKGKFGRNLLQVAACCSKDIKTHQFLWKIFRDFYKSDQEFLEFLNQIDIENNNIFHLAAWFSSKEIFEFMIDELEKIASKEEIRNILRTLGMANRNLLQLAVINSKSIELHKYLWKIIRKYFPAFEILKLINHCDVGGDNILHNTVYWSTKDIAEFIWNQIKKLLTTKEEQIEYLKKKGQHSENQSKDPEVRIWVEKIINEH